MKLCTKCKKEKSFNEFFSRKSRKSGIRSQCKECETIKSKVYYKENIEKFKEYEKIRQRDPNRNKIFREKIGEEEYKKRERKYNLKRKFGITPEQYDELLKQQNYCCAICGKHESHFKQRMHVEHNHQTLEIQGITCAYCNFKILGRNRNPDLLRKAADYLEFSHTGLYVPEKRKKKR